MSQVSGHSAGSCSCRVKASLVRRNMACLSPSFCFISPMAESAFLVLSGQAMSWGCLAIASSQAVSRGLHIPPEAGYNPDYQAASVGPGLRPSPSRHSALAAPVQPGVARVPFSPDASPWSWPARRRVSSFLYKLNVFSTTLPVLLSKMASWKQPQGHRPLGRSRPHEPRRAWLANCATLALPIPVRIQRQRPSGSAKAKHLQPERDPRQV